MLCMLLHTDSSTPLKTCFKDVSFGKVSCLCRKFHGHFCLKYISKMSLLACTSQDVAEDFMHVHSCPEMTYTRSSEGQNLQFSYTNRIILYLTQQSQSDEQQPGAAVVHLLIPIHTIVKIRFSCYFYSDILCIKMMMTLQLPSNLMCTHPHC